VELGRIEDARSLLDLYEGRARSVDRPRALAASARCHGLLDAAGGDPDAALASLDEAFAQLQRVEMPIERARTLLALGRVQRRRRQKRLARLAFEQALATFEGAGAKLWAEQTRRELARVTTRRAPTGLTPTEERIARLAADGLSNREIAEHAFVARSTVEANLKRAYRKLGISSRAQLGRALDRAAGNPGS
jgi:DNA-binding CsgD family transcriptional regulator